MAGNINSEISKNSSTDRETFASKWGFILASVGAAMGMANLWMFPWRLGTYGGAAFLMPYLFFLFFFSIYGLMGEYALGRRMQNGTVGAFDKVLKEKGKKWGSLLGFFPALAVTGVFTFYVIVQSWIIHYFYLALSGQLFKMDINSYFSNYAGTGATIPWHILSLLLVLAVVILGVQKGIEKVCKIMMPIFYVIMFIIMIRSLTLPGALEGVKFLLIPKWEHLFNIKTWVMALGMSFFTLSLGSGNVAYGSYLKAEEDIPDASWKTACFDTLASMMAALAIMPAVFAFGLDPGAGPQLMFITLPNVFNNMAGGRIISILFFLIVFFAALSSSIHMIEGPVEGLIDKLKCSRKVAVCLLIVTALIIGFFLDTNMELFGTFSDFFSVLLLPSSAVLIAVVLYWVYGADKALEEINTGAKRPVGAWFGPFMKYIFTPVTFIILLAGYFVGGF